MSTDILHFGTNPFTIVDDVDGDQDDRRLRAELEQVIAEQFNDFDLGNEPEDPPGSHVEEQNTMTATCPDDLASILAAGKLSLLERAIQRFGEEETHPTGDPLFDHSSSNTSSQAKEFSDSSNTNPSGNSIHEFSNPPTTGHTITAAPTYDLGFNNNNVGSEFDDPSVGQPSVTSDTKLLNQNTQRYRQSHVNSKSPYNQGSEPTWGTGFPEGVAQQYFMVLQHGRDSISSSVQTSERAVHRTQSLAPSSMTSHYYSAASNTQVVQSSAPSDRVGGTNSVLPSSNVVTTDQTGHSRKITPAKLSPVTHQWPAGEFVATSANEQRVPVQLDLNERQRLPPSESFDPSNHLPIDVEDRRELLYAARGRQLEELTTDLNRVRDELAKEKRLAAHRLTLAEAERQNLTSKLSSSENATREIQQQLNAEQEHVSKLIQRLNALEKSNSELTNELATLRSTNESLSAQLVELTTGDAARRAEEREGKLTEALERRYALANEAANAELQLAKQRLLDKDKELAEIQRQLETCKADANKAQAEFRETILRANKQLEDAQQHCQRLASSALCSEVTDLRQKLCELETSRKITEDVNKILQEELHDLREQISLYESALRLDAEYKGDHYADIIASQYNQSSPMPEPPLVKKKRPKSLDHVSFCENEFTICGSGAKQRPSSAVENVLGASENDRGGEEFPRLYGTYAPNSVGSLSEPPKSIRRTQTPSSSEHVSDTFRPSSQQKFVTSTPGSPSVLNRLRSELTRALSSYKSKREQVTQLHEVVFTTRCQLHEAVEKSKRTEKNTALLQDRLMCLEQELTNARELKGTPGPREHLLQGQVERLKADYAALEEELRSTRARLQAALGAEARALENEKTATERLSASAAERDAAIDRARAVCEAHYTSMRRRLEVDWANEREAATKRAEQALSQARQECAELEIELHRVTKLYQESQMATQQAVDNALAEAMQEREAERIRFWREELPNQLAAARSTWEQEWSNREALHESEKWAAREHAVKRLANVVSSACQTQRTSSTTDCDTNTRIVKFSSANVQTEITSILSLCGLVGGDEYSERTKRSGHTDLRVLPKVFGDHCIQCLNVQLLDSSTLNVQVLDDLLRRFLKDRFKLYRRRAWNSVGKALSEAIRSHDLDKILQSVFDKVKTVDSEAGSTSPDPAECIDKAISPFEFGASDSDGCVDPVDGYATRSEVLKRIEQLVITLLRMKEELDKAKASLRQTELGTTETSNTKPLASEVYQSALRKIKQEVLNYVQTCQTRAAQTLHSELARVHRRACRQFTNNLRQALYEAGAPMSLSPIGAAPRMVFPSRRHASLPRPTPAVRDTSSVNPPAPIRRTHNSEQSDSQQDTSTLPMSSDISTSIVNKLFPSGNLPTDLESLLHVIDNVCASTESRFQAELSTGTALFDHSTELSSKSPLRATADLPSDSQRCIAVNPPVSGDFKSDTRSAKSDSVDMKDSGIQPNPSSSISRHPYIPPTEVSTCLHSAAEDDPVSECAACSTVPLASVTPVNPKKRTIRSPVRLAPTTHATTPNRYQPVQSFGVKSSVRPSDTVSPPMPLPRHLNAFVSDEVTSPSSLTTFAAVAPIQKRLPSTNTRVAKSPSSPIPNSFAQTRRALNSNLSPNSLPVPSSKRGDR